MIETETRIGWQDYLAIVLRRRWVFAVPCVLVVAIALVVGLFLPRIYRAETVLLIEDQKVINPLMEGLAVATPAGERLRTLREELLSWTSLSRLIHDLRMDSRARSPLAFEHVVKDLQKHIAVQLRGRDLVSISFEHTDPKLAQTVVNSITQIYMDRTAESATAEAETAISFLEAEMAVYQQELEDSEQALREFKELYVMQMPVANQLNDQIIELEVSLAQMLVENTEAHPTVIQTRRHIEELKQKRNDEIKRVIVMALAKGHDPEFYQDLALALANPVGAASADPTVQTATTAYHALVQRLESPTPPTPVVPPMPVITTPDGAEGQAAVEIIGAGAASISLTPREEQELSRLTRDYQVHSRTYQHMQERLERAKTTQRLESSDEGTKFKILEPARLPLRPVRPNFLAIFGFSLLFGIFVGAGAAFVAEYLDQSFQSAEDLQTALELPVIGSISRIVTEGDLELRQQRRKTWLSWKSYLGRFKAYIVTPIWSRVDQALVRWGL